MNIRALEKVLELLSGNCQDDMADKFSSPEEKLEEAVAESKPGLDDEEDMGEGTDEMSVGDVVAEENAEEDEHDPNNIKAVIEKFMRQGKPPARKPGTLTIIAEDRKKLPMKKV